MRALLVVMRTDGRAARGPIGDAEGEREGVGRLVG